MSEETRKPFRQVVCDLGHVWLFEVERQEDLTVTSVDTLDERPYVIFRDRTMVLCPHCRSGCHFTGMRGLMEVKYTPMEAS